MAVRAGSHVGHPIRQSYAARACSPPCQGSTASSWCARWVPTLTINGKHADLAEAARRFAPDGVDAILALAGGDALDVLRRGGRLAYPNGIEPEPKPRHGIKVVSYDGTSGIPRIRAARPGRRGCEAQGPNRGSLQPGRCRPKPPAPAEGHILGKIVLRTHRS